MRVKEQVIFDIKTEKFKYLHREENKIRNIVDIDVLNKRLNQIRKYNIYSNAKMIIFSVVAIFIFILISLKF
tara:strand:+ start:680 stop:895 length:216 start_codon:yes stop_codon:yes gene_type:complete